MQPIRYRGEFVAAVVGGEVALFDDALEARGWDDPRLRFVAAMCRLEMELHLGRVHGGYDDERAEGYARELLMPEQEFAALASLPDAYLATCFCVPPEQVPARREELGLATDADGADRRPPERRP